MAYRSPVVGRHGDGCPEKRLPRRVKEVMRKACAGRQRTKLHGRETGLVVLSVIRCDPLNSTRQEGRTR